MIPLYLVILVLVLLIAYLIYVYQKQLKKTKEIKAGLEVKIKSANKQVEDKKQEIENQTKALSEKQVEDEKRNWASSGMAQFSDYLREDTDNLDHFSLKIITQLTEFIGANVGGLFIKNDDNENDIFYELRGAYAYNRNKFIKKNLKIGEGLIGACAFDKKTIYYTEIPENYIKIGSGMGETPPKSLLIVPCIFNEEVFGIIEVASLEGLGDYKITFIEELGEKLASTISIVKNNERMARLLEQSKEQANELITSEEELRQNLEEMRATQEQSDKREKEIIQQMEIFKKDNSLLKFKIKELER